MGVKEAIALIEKHAGNWHIMCKRAVQNMDYGNAKSYADMEYAARALVVELEREYYNTERGTNNED